MTVVREILLDPDLQPTPGRVVVAIATPVTPPADPGFDPTQNYTITDVASMDLGDGAWSIDLAPTDGFNDGAVYQRTAYLPSATLVDYFTVPSSGGPYDLQDLIAPQPGSTTVIRLNVDGDAGDLVGFNGPDQVARISGHAVPDNYALVRDSSKPTGVAWGPMTATVDLGPLEAEVAALGDTTDDLTTVVTALDAEATAEADTRANADTALDGRLDTVETDTASLQAQIDAFDETFDPLGAAALAQDLAAGYTDDAAADLQSQIDGFSNDFDPQGAASLALLTANAHTDAGDAALDTRLDTLEADPTTGTAVAAEASARATADGVNAAAITAEASTRATQDTNEATARAAADSSEATARAAADTTLTNAVTAEATARANGDTAAVATAATYTDTKVAALVSGAPGVLDTLNELAAALGNDPNFATTMATTIAAKLAKASNLSDITSPSDALKNLSVWVDATGPGYGVVAGSSSATTTANATALANALAYGAAHSIPVLLPAGTWVIKRVVIPANTKLIGLGPTTIIKHDIVNDAAGTEMFHVSGNGVEITDMILDGNTGGVQTDSHNKASVYIDSTDGFVMDRVTVQNTSGDGIIIDGGCRNLEFAFCRILSPNHFGIVSRFTTLQSIQFLNVHDCYFERIYNGGSAVGGTTAVTNPNGVVSAIASLVIPAGATGSGPYSLRVDHGEFLPVVVSGISPGIITQGSINLYYNANPVFDAGTTGAATVSVFVYSGSGTINIGALSYTDAAPAMLDVRVVNNFFYCIDHDCVAMYSQKNQRIYMAGNVADNLDADTATYYVPSDATFGGAGGAGGGLCHLGGTDIVILGNIIRGSDGRAIALGNYPNATLPRGNRATIANNVVFHTQLGVGTNPLGGNTTRAPRGAPQVAVAAGSDGANVTTFAGTTLNTTTTTGLGFLAGGASRFLEVDTTTGTAILSYSAVAANTFTVTYVSGSGIIHTGGRVREAIAYGPNGEGILLQNYTDVTITGNKLYQCAESGIHPSAGPGTNLQPLATSKYTAIVGNQIQQCLGEAIWVEDASFCTVVGNVSNDNGGTTLPGIRLTGSASCTVMGNTIVSSGADGVLMENGVHVTSDTCIHNIVQGNIVKNSGGWGLRTTGASDYTTSLGNSYDANVSGAESLTGTHNIQASAGTIFLDASFTVTDDTDPTKTAKFDLSGMTTGRRATLLFNNAADATYTFPASTDTLLGRTTDATVTTKRLSDSTVVFVSASDSTKALRFSLGGGVAGKTTFIVASPTVDRTLTLPDVTATVATRSDTLNMFAPTTSAQLLGLLTDPTGTGVAVFGTEPTLLGLIVSLGSSAANISARTVAGSIIYELLRSNAGNTYPTSGQNMGVIRARAWDGLTAPTVSGAFISFDLDENASATAYGMHIEFGTALVGGGSPAAVRRWRFANDGTTRTLAAIAVGVAALTTAPTAGYMLDVIGKVRTTDNVDVTGAISATGSIKSSSASAGIGYATGAGGTVTQTAGAKTTGVTLNRPTGTIALETTDAILSAGTRTFVLTNSAIAANDIVLVNIVSATNNPTLYRIHAGNTAAGGAVTITLVNNTGLSSGTDAIVIGFSVIKTATA